jgi:hypothetical protein
MKLINKTPNGQIMYCPGHNTYHLEFGNLFIHLSHDELMSFKRYVESIDYKFYLSHNRNTQNRRKLLLNIGSGRIFLGLHAQEYIELRSLLSFRKKTDVDIIENIEVIEHEMIFN